MRNTSVTLEQIEKALIAQKKLKNRYNELIRIVAQMKLDDEPKDKVRPYEVAAMELGALMDRYTYWEDVHAYMEKWRKCS